MSIKDFDFNRPEIVEYEFKPLRNTFIFKTKFPEIPPNKGTLEYIFDCLKPYLKALNCSNFNKINIEPILNSAVELFRESENVSINLNYSPKEYFVTGDKEQLMRVFINIIKNSTQAIPENINGIIDINIEEKMDNFIISFKDNGVGIPVEKREHIFEPNFTTKNSGTGLGLAISKNIIERMNGKIWFDSVVDEYSIFYVELPKMN